MQAGGAYGPSQRLGLECPGEQYNTKGETTAFQTPTIEGRVTKDTTGNLYYRTLEETEAAAIIYLNGKAGIDEEISNTIIRGEVTPFSFGGNMIYHPQKFEVNFDGVER